MSLVIAVCSRTQIVIAGDTQLNDDNGVLPITGMKVIPVGQYAIAGFTGDYDGTIQVGHLFSAKAELYSASIKRIRRLLLSGSGKAITPMIFTGSRSVIFLHPVPFSVQSGAARTLPLFLWPNQAAFHSRRYR